MPSCQAQLCSSDGCGGTCGPCDPGTTFPGIAPVTLGTANALVAAGDGIHVATVRGTDAACPGAPVSSIGRMDVWTVPVTGAASHRTIGAHVAQNAVLYSKASDLVYQDGSACDGHGELWLAHADGTGGHRIASNVGMFQTAGTTVVYESRGDSAIYARQIPDGVPIKLVSGGSNFLTGLIFQISPDGSAMWAYTSGVTELRLARTDGSAATTLVSPPDQLAGAPMWSLDSLHLAFRWADNVPPFAVPLDAVDRDGRSRTELTAAGATNPYASGAFVSDGRLAYITADGASFDVVLHSFAGAPEVRIGSVSSPAFPGAITALALSADGQRLYANVDDATTRVSNLMMGRADRSGTAAVLSVGGGGWSESQDGSTVAVAGAYSTTNTSVITLGVGTQTLPGVPAYVPAYEPIAAHPRLLVNQGGALLAYPTAGTGAGSVLTGFMGTGELNAWVAAHNAPFVFGWAGSLALYSSAIHGTSGQLGFDLMGWTSDSAAGRLLASASRYQLLASPSRIFAVTDAGRLFMIPH